jgi:hypothetical protein
MSYIGNQPTSVAFLTDTFNGNGSTTAFTMSVAPATTSSMLVAITGVVQDPSTYSIVGTTLNFSAAPPSGTGNISVRYLGIPASGVATTAYRTVTEFTATAAQTTFSVPSYTVGYIDVYRNGVMLGSADYTASNGTTVVLAAGATAGDLVETISFFVSSVLNAIPATPGSVVSSYIANDAVGSAQIAAGAVGTSEIASSVTLTTPTLSSPVTSGTPSGVGVLTSDTAKTATGTSVDFTGIPSWVKRITVMFNGVSTNGSSFVLVRVGSGSIQTSGYDSTASAGANVGQYHSTTAGFFSTYPAQASNGVLKGTMVLTLLNSNTWVQSGNISDSAYQLVNSGSSGSVTLSSTLDRIRITTVNGTDVFDAGSINILYE